MMTTRHQLEKTTTSQERGQKRSATRFRWKLMTTCHKPGKKPGMKRHKIQTENDDNAPQAKNEAPQD